jgi:HEPN domain-containing protein
MSYDERDAAMDEMYQSIGDELYPEHRAQAIGEFTADRLRSFYLAHPMVMRPAVDAFQEAKRLKANGHHAAAVVFCATTIELFLKATLLQPIIYGLVHNEALAEIIVKHAVGQTGFDRYRDLLSRLFQELASLDIASVSREGVPMSLIDESKRVQALRNDIIHKGHSADPVAAENAVAVAAAVFDEIVVNVLWSIGLAVGEKGRIAPSINLNNQG